MLGCPQDSLCVTMVPGEVFRQAPKRLIFITIHRLKIAETINSAITILGKCWTLPDCPILPFQLALRSVDFTGEGISPPRLSASIGRRSRVNSDDYAAFNAGLVKTVFKGVTVDVRWYDTDRSSLGFPYEGRGVISARMAF